MDDANQSTPPGGGIDADVAEDVAESLLKACQCIKWRQLAKVKSKLVPTEEDAGMLIFCGFLLASCHLEHVLELLPKLPQALALQASLELMAGQRKSARNLLKRLLLANPMDIRCFTLCHVLQDQIGKDKIDYRKLIKAMEPLVKKIEWGSI